MTPRNGTEATFLHLWTLTTTEKLAQASLTQAEQRLMGLIAGFEKDRDDFLSEIERRCKLSSGALMETHILDLERGIVRERSGEELPDVAREMVA